VTVGLNTLGMIINKTENHCPTEAGKMRFRKRAMTGKGKHHGGDDKRRSQESE